MSPGNDQLLLLCVPVDQAFCQPTRSPSPGCLRKFFPILMPGSSEAAACHGSCRGLAGGWWEESPMLSLVRPAHMCATSWSEDDHDYWSRMWSMLNTQYQTLQVTGYPETLWSFHPWRYSKPDCRVLGHVEQGQWVGWSPKGHTTSAVLQFCEIRLLQSTACSLEPSRQKKSLESYCPQIL